MGSGKAAVRGVAWAGAGVLALGAGVAGYRLVRADVRAEVYRQRLADLVGEYEALRGRFNEVVRRTAVTELVVRDGRLSVVVRTAAGVVREIPTSLDPSGEIYVDFVVRDGRLLIRRVFDARTPPHAGVLIDPDLEEVRWTDGWPDQPPVGSAAYGKAVYRRLGEGRWVVTVTGDGSLGLARAKEDEPVELVAAPAVRDYAQIEREAEARVGSVGVRDVLEALVGGGR